MTGGFATVFGAGFALVFEVGAAVFELLFAPEDLVAGLAELNFPVDFVVVFAADFAGDLFADLLDVAFAICLPDDFAAEDFDEDFVDADFGAEADLVTAGFGAGEDFSFPPPKIPRIRFFSRPPFGALDPALPALFAPAAFLALSALVVVFELTAILLSRPP